MSESLERAISRFRRTANANGAKPGKQPAAAFRASVELRLGNLERDVSELKGRINGLIFVVVGAVITQVVLRLVA
jgi:hypothetical protein